VIFGGFFSVRWSDLVRDTVMTRDATEGPTLGHR
jgi:hypothetical protein